MARDVAVDLGTFGTRAVVRGVDLTIEEPTVVAFDSQSGRVADIGRAALRIHEEQPEKVELVWPLRNGVVADGQVLQQFLTRLVSPLSGHLLDRLNLVVAVPSSATPIERRLVKEAGKRAGAWQVHLIEHVMAAALGGDLPVHEPIGTMVVDVGAGIVEAAVLSLGSVVASSNVPMGSSDVNRSIQNVLRRDYGMFISDYTAEEIKKALGSMHMNDNSLVIEAQGTMLIDGSKATAVLEATELSGALTPFIDAVSEAVRSTLVQTPTELSQDLISRGLYLAGGASALRSLPERLSADFGLPVHIFDDPSLVVLRGAGKCVEAMERLGELFLVET